MLTMFLGEALLCRFLLAVVTTVGVLVGLIIGLILVLTVLELGLRILRKLGLVRRRG